MKRMKKNQKGFTVVELIVIVTVLAILAAIAIPVAADLVGRANTSSNSANIALFESAIEKYVATPATATPAGGGGTYPTNGTEAGTAIKRFTNIGTAGTIPTPTGGGSFIYNTTTHKVNTTSAAINAPWSLIN
ncbi:MAG: prepilin-type N-terminal cleavage/methylation domain-containing protein [Clostridia bacterium]|nr:prepilin-type N-terminal cleavage/methylation domain-containing protein [Clostridia bacterium]